MGTTRELPISDIQLSVSAAGAALQPDGIPREAVAAAGTLAPQLSQGRAQWNHSADKIVRSVLCSWQNTAWCSIHGIHQGHERL